MIEKANVFWHLEVVHPDPDAAAAFRLIDAMSEIGLRLEPMESIPGFLPGEKV